MDQGQRPLAKALEESAVAVPVAPWLLPPSR